MSDKWNDKTTGLCLAMLIGTNRHNKLQAAIMVITSFVLVMGGTLTSSVITTLDQVLTPEDFIQKGTLSNVAQDVMTPHGRLWTTALVVSAVLLLSSMYPFWLYRSWQPWHTAEENPLVHGVFQSKRERLCRSLWVVLPNVGFILTGAIPSLSGVHGYKLALTGVHNTSAPLSMLFCMLMETIQLAFGENAFTYFFSREAAPLHGPLSIGQRIRVVTVCLAWSFGIMFVSIQGYLFLCVNERYFVALLSYYSEVFGLVLAFAMPAISGADYLLNMEEGTVLEETHRMICNHLIGSPCADDAKKQE